MSMTLPAPLKRIAAIRRCLVVFAVWFAFHTAPPLLYGQKTELRLDDTRAPDLPAGSIIALTRITGGVRSGVDNGCNDDHYHGPGGPITINFNPSLTITATAKGPHTDTKLPTCGYGKIVPEQNTGTAGNDTFIVDGENDLVNGLAGNDILDGGAGNDRLIGDAGDDQLAGGVGEDTLEAGDGADRVYGGSSGDVIDGGPGEDFLYAEDGNDRITGGPGSDAIFAGPGDDQADGGDDDDFLKGEDGDDSLRGGPGSDGLAGGPGNDNLVGGDGNDELRGDAGADKLVGDAGADLLVGGDGDDELQGGDQNDFLHGQEGNDRLDGGAGNDRMTGGPGNDDMFGGPGDDHMAGDTGDDNLYGGDGNDELDGGAGRNVLTQGALIVSALDSGPESTIISGDAGDDTIIIRAGNVGFGGRQSIDGGTGNDTLVLNGFPYSAIAGSAPNFTITDPLTGGTYAVTGVERIVHSLFFAQAASGAGYVSSFVFSNPSSASTVQGSLRLSNDDGSPLSVSLNGMPASSNIGFTIPPLGSVTLASDAAGALRVGAAEVEADRPLGGVIRFAAPLLGIVGVGDSRLSDSFMIPVVVDVARGFSTGVAIYNEGPGKTLTLQVHQTSGSTQMQTTLDLPENGHLARFVHELFPALTNFQGTLVVSDARVAATAILLGSQPGEFTTLPVIPIDVQTPLQTLHFAQFGNGGNGFGSSIFLVNPSESILARGEILVFDDGGAPLPIRLNGASPASRIPFEIAPRGSAVFATDGLGSLQVGAARVVVSQGTVGGVLRFTLSPLGITGVGSGSVLREFIAPVRRSVAGAFNTGVALHAAGSSSVTLKLTLRNADGQAVSGGSADVVIPANGHVARFINELFPAADTDNFSGTLTAAAQGGTVAAIAIELGTRPGEFTTLPVTALESNAVASPALPR